MRGKILLLAVLVLVVFGLYSRSQEDSKMTHVIYSIEEKKIGNLEYQKTTKKLWLVGYKFMRLEEEYNTEYESHDLSIVAVPNIYRINTVKKTGQHYRDRDPSQSIHIPVLPMEFRRGFEELKFGQELEFFLERKVKPRALTRGDTDHYQQYLLKSEPAAETTWPATLTLLVDDATGKPYEVSVKRGRDRLVILYDTYEKGLEPDMSLFELPPDLKMSKSAF